MLGNFLSIFLTCKVLYQIIQFIVAKYPHKVYNTCTFIRGNSDASKSRNGAFIPC